MKEIRKTIALLYSMVLSGEKTNETVTKMVKKSIGEIDAILANPIDAMVMQKIAEIREQIKDHFNSENKILDDVKELINSNEYKIRKAEIKRQLFYMRLILSNFTA